MNYSEIINICQKLNEQGKQPSIALIKARLKAPTPLPSIIAGLKSWQSNPNEVVQVEEQTAETSTRTLEQRVGELESQVEKLQKQLNSLLSQNTSDD